MPTMGFLPGTEEKNTQQGTNVKPQQASSVVAGVDLSGVQPLTDDERYLCYDAARTAVVDRMAGKKPKREDFLDNAIGKVPPFVMKIMIGMMILFAIGVFYVSAVKLYSIGAATFGEEIDSPILVSFAGLSAIVAAEVGAMLFMTATTVLASEKWHRIFFTGGTVLCIMFALIGNVQFTLVDDGATWYDFRSNPFEFYEAFLFPGLTLILGFTLERMFFAEMHRRMLNEAAYQEALTTWNDLSLSPEDTPEFESVYGQKLKVAIREKNTKRGKGRPSQAFLDHVELINNLTSTHWRWLLRREVAEDKIATGLLSETQTVTQAVELIEQAIAGTVVQATVDNTEVVNVLQQLLTQAQQQPIIITPTTSAYIDTHVLDDRNQIGPVLQVALDYLDAHYADSEVPSVRQLHRECGASIGTCKKALDLFKK